MDVVSVTGHFTLEERSIGSHLMGGEVATNKYLMWCDAGIKIHPVGNRPSVVK
jgi:hypothetical protein